MPQLEKELRDLGLTVPIRAFVPDNPPAPDPIPDLIPPVPVVEKNLPLKSGYLGVLVFMGLVILGDKYSFVGWIMGVGGVIGLTGCFVWEHFQRRKRRGT